MDKSIFETLKETVGNVLSSIVDVLKKYKKYIFLLVIICIVAFGSIKLIEYLKTQKGIIYLSDKIQQDLGCKETGICTYTNNTSQQNYVWYSGFMWRILKINDDGTIKLVLNESVGLVNYFNALNNDYMESFIRLWLNEGVFLNGMNQPDEFISNYDFCYGNDSNECNNTTNDKVGLLTYSEYEQAGGESSYLNIGIPFWTITRKKNSDTEVYIVDETGKLKTVNSGEFYQVRPVINLESKVMVISGTDGSENNPYVLKGDEGIDSNEYLVGRYTGEFVKFAGKIWRIAETTDNYTKLVLYGKDTKMVFGTNDTYQDNDNTIRNYLKNVYYNILKGALPNIDSYLATGTFYGGILKNGDAYTNIKISSDLYGSTTDRIGILSVGEMFSGNDLLLEDKDISWTMTPNGENKLWLSNGITSTTDEEHSVRPVIYLQSEVYVVGGSGNGRTRNTAFEVAIEE